MFLVIDNYDSFVHNLARYVALCGAEYDIYRNDKITIDDIKNMQPEGVILSPGPCTPGEAGICIDAVKAFAETIPILGVCLGHQAIGEAYGCKTTQSDKPIHGKSSVITHNSKGIFQDIPSPLEVGRYHSLITTETHDYADLEITARLKDNTVMAMQHKKYPVYGVQFHPESILTQGGLQIMQNFVQISKEWNKRKAS